jgi:hypothetical protein
LSRIDSFSMNYSGRVSFAASGGGTSAVWSELSGSTAIAAGFSSAPGLSPYSVFAPNSFATQTLSPWVRLDDHGRTLMSGLYQTVASTGSVYNAAGFWSDNGQSKELIAAENTAAPIGYQGLYFHNFGPVQVGINQLPSLTPSAFGGSYWTVNAQLRQIGPSSSFDIPSYWLMGPEGARLLYMPSTTIPNYVTLDMATNRLGEAAYETFDVPNNPTLLRELAGLTQTIVGPSTVLPGFASTLEGGEISSLKLNKAGSLAFAARKYQPQQSVWEGIFVADAAGTIRTALIDGTPVPGVPGSTFSSISTQQPTLSILAQGEHDELVINAREVVTATPSTSRRSLWLERNGSLQALATEGLTLPGLESAEIIKGQGSIPLFSQAHVNSQGLVVFGAGILSMTRAGTGVWALLPGATEVTPIALPGQTITLSDGTEEMLGSITLGDVNDRGQIILKSRRNDVDVLFVVNSHATLSDFDGDGTVDGDDLAVLKQGFGSENSTLAMGDGNGDGAVDGADFLRWQREATITGPPVAAGVPEPSSLALLAMAALVGRCSRFCRQARG